MPYTFGQQPSDVVTNSRGDVVGGIPVSIYTTKENATDGVARLSVVSTDSKGHWTYTHGSLGIIWAKVPKGSPFAVVSIEALSEAMDTGGPSGTTLQKDQNLLDLPSASTARTNLGLGAAAVAGFGSTAGTVVEGNDSRLSGMTNASFINSGTIGDAFLPARLSTSSLDAAYSDPPLGSADNPITSAAASRPVGMSVVYWQTDTQPTQAQVQDVVFLPLPEPGVVSGSAGGNAALQSLINALEAQGLITDNTSGVAPVFVNESPPATGTVGSAYNYTYTATGTPAPTFAVTSGALPAGVTLSSGGVLSGTPSAAATYNWTVSAQNGTAPDDTSADTVTTSNPVSAVMYGPAIGSDTKANVPIGEYKSAIRFVAPSTANLSSVRFTLRSGPGGAYSLGNFGTITMSVRPDNGSGLPSATVLATKTFTPSGSNSVGTEVYRLETFSSPPALTSGTRYYIVFEQATGGASNFISMNHIFIYGSVLSPRQPKFADADYGLLNTASGGSTFTGVSGNYTPVCDITMSDGAHAGQAYYEPEVAMWKSITGTNFKVREVFTVTGGNKTIQTVGARVRRTNSGTSALYLALWDSTTLIDEVAIPAASVPVTQPGSDNGGAVWVSGNLASQRTLTNGATYSLRLSCAADTAYATAPPIRSGQSISGTPYFGSYDFADGWGEFATTGSNWAKIYDYDQVDVQCYLT